MKLRWNFRLEPHANPAWVVCNCGTGGTAATIGRYIRYRGLNTGVCATDPENSVFFEVFKTGDAKRTIAASSRIEGIGRPRVERSFVLGVIDTMLSVPDAANIAAVHYLAKTLVRCCGGSTGTNFIGALTLARQMHERGEAGSIVMILCKGGDGYQGTYYNDAWLAKHGFDMAAGVERVRACAERGSSLRWEVTVGESVCGAGGGFVAN